MAGSTGIVDLPAGLLPIIQQGMLERRFLLALQSKRAYRLHAIQEDIPINIGESITKTRYGRRAPKEDPVSPTVINSNLDNGLTPETSTIEQYTLTMNEYPGTVNINQLQDLAAIAKQMDREMWNNGDQAAGTLDRLARKALFAAYGTGRSRVRSSGGTLSTTQAPVDDIRGFQFVFKNGKLVPVSGSDTLTVQATAGTAGGVTQTLTVTGVTAHVSNISTVPGGISGQLTFSTATLPVAGDIFEAATAPTIIRPNGRIGTHLLTASDVFSMSLVADAVAVLASNGIPTCEDGYYHCILSPDSYRQLFGDQDFKAATQGRIEAVEIRRGVVSEIYNVRFLQTTEGYIQAAGGGVNVKVQRPIVVGGESLVQGNFAGLKLYAARGLSVSDIRVVENVAHIIRPAMDRLAQVIAMSWLFVGDFVCPTDITTTSAVIPTANAALYKRAVVIEHAS